MNVIQYLFIISAMDTANNANFSIDALLGPQQQQQQELVKKLPSTPCIPSLSPTTQTKKSSNGKQIDFFSVYISYAFKKYYKKSRKKVTTF